MELRQSRPRAEMGVVRMRREVRVGVGCVVM